MTVPDKIQIFRKALADTFDLMLIHDSYNSGRMIGPQPWADLYNFLADIHGNYLHEQGFYDAKS
jgi:hypothetical protein